MFNLLLVLVGASMANNDSKLESSVGTALLGVGIARTLNEYIEE